MSTSPPYTLTNESIVVVWQGKSHTVQKSSPNFMPLKNAIMEERWSDIPKHLTITSSLQDWAKGEFTIVGNVFSYKGTELPEDINQRIISMARKGENPEPLFKFWQRLQKNPSFRSVKQLWGFLQHQGIPLTEDGCLLAYKSVRDDYKDHHSGKFNNRPGEVLEMPRNQISDDPNLACHDGFHVGALEYAKSFGSNRRLVICKIDPADVVCVPYDSSSQKMRVCKYEVMGNHNGELLSSTTFTEDSYEDDEDIDNSSDVDESDDDSEEVDEIDEDEDVDEKPAEKKAKTSSKKPNEKRKPKKGFAKLDKMSMEELLGQSIETLRRYAFKGLDIVGASKIPGGKVALISRILEVRE